MTTEPKILTDEQIESLTQQYTVTAPDGNVVTTGPWQFARAVEQAVLQSPGIQALRDLLKEARQQLPLAAQFWNEDEEPERRSRNVKRVMELIVRIDAAMGTYQDNHQ